MSTEPTTLPQFPITTLADGTVILGLDRNGMRIADFQGWLHYPTECCDGTLDGGGFCKQCYSEVPSALYGGCPERADVVAAYDPATYVSPIMA